MGKKCTWPMEAQVKIQKLEAEIERRGELLEGIVDECQGYGYPDSTPNAAGSLVSMEPTPLDMVSYVISKLKAENKKLKGLLNEALDRLESSADTLERGARDFEAARNVVATENAKLKADLAKAKAENADLQTKFSNLGGLCLIFPPKKAQAVLKERLPPHINCPYCDGAGNLIT